MSLNLGKEEEQELNDILLAITSSLKNKNQENIREQCSKISKLIRSKIQNESAIIFIIKNISSFITLEAINQNHKGFNLLDAIIRTLNPDEMIIYLSEILTSLQENISDEYIQDVENSYLNILKGCHEIKENSEIFKLLNGFCIYNMKQSSLCSQEIGVKTFLALINFLSLNNDNNDFDVQKIIWENISDLLEDNQFLKKYELLNCLNELILISENNFDQFAAVTLYKILDFLNDENDNNKIMTLEIIKNLLIYCEKSISPLKEQIQNFMEVIESSPNEKIEEERENIIKLLGNYKNKKERKTSENILNKETSIKEKMGLSKSENKKKKEIKENDIDNIKNKKNQILTSNIKENENPLKLSDLTEEKPELIRKKIPLMNRKKKNNNNTNNNSQKIRTKNPKVDLPIKKNHSIEIVESEIKDNIENNSINSTYNKLINEYENKISILLSQMKTMSDKQLYLLDVISNLQNYSREQINYLNKKINDLENNILKQKESDNTNNINNNNISNNNLEKENTINEKLKNCISSGDELSIINCISNINLKEIKDLEINIIEDILLVLCPILSKGNYIHECISFIKAILMSYNNQIQLREVSLKNINDILLYIKNNINDVKDEDIIDISLLISYLKKK